MGRAAARFLRRPLPYAVQHQVKRDLGGLGAVFRAPAVWRALGLDVLGLLPDSGSRRGESAPVQIEYASGLARPDVPDSIDQDDHRRRESERDPVHRHGGRRKAAGSYRHGPGGKRRDAVREWTAAIDLAGIQEWLEGERRHPGKRRLQAAFVSRADDGDRPSGAEFGIQSALPVALHSRSTRSGWIESRRSRAANRRSDRRRGVAADDVHVRGRNDGWNLPELYLDRN